MIKRTVRKISAAAFGVPLSSFLVWFVPVQFGSPAIPPEVAAAIGAVITNLISLVIPDHMEA